MPKAQSTKHKSCKRMKAHKCIEVGSTQALAQLHKGHTLHRVHKYTNGYKRTKALHKNKHVGLLQRQNIKTAQEGSTGEGQTSISSNNGHK